MIETLVANLVLFAVLLAIVHSLRPRPYRPKAPPKAPPRVERYSRRGFYK